MDPIGAHKAVVLTSLSQQGFGTTLAFRNTWVALAERGLIGPSTGFRRDFCKARHVQVSIKGIGTKRFAVVRGLPIVYSIRSGSGPLLEGIGRRSFISQLNRLGHLISSPLLCSPIHLQRPAREEDLREEADLHSIVRSAYRAEYEAPFVQGEADLFYETEPAGSARDRALAAAQIARGVKNENKLTDAIFYARHPEWKGKALKTASRALRAEWLQIRDALVRPLLKSAKPPSTPFSPPTPAPAPPPPAPSVQLASPAPQPSGQQGAGITGYNSFDNIRKYRPAEYQKALAAQEAFQKVKGFLPWYQKIMNATSGVSIGLDSYGIGNLVFHMDKHSFSELVQSRELVNKAVETIGSGMLGELEFTVDFIGLLGLGAMILDLARGIDNERNLGGVGPQYDRWRRDQALKFVIGLLAEDLSRLDLRNSYFISRNVRDLVNEITTDLAEFKPLNDAFVSYLLLEDQLARIAQDRGTVPDVLPPDPPVMRSRP